MHLILRYLEPGGLGGFRYGVSCRRGAVRHVHINGLVLVEARSAGTSYGLLVDYRLDMIHVGVLLISWLPVIKLLFDASDPDAHFYAIAYICTNPNYRYSSNANGVFVNKLQNNGLHKTQNHFVYECHTPRDSKSRYSSLGCESSAIGSDASIERVKDRFCFVSLIKTPEEFKDKLVLRLSTKNVLLRERKAYCDYVTWHCACLRTGKPKNDRYYTVEVCILWKCKRCFIAYKSTL